jgi:hypothetical protein
VRALPIGGSANSNRAFAERRQDPFEAKPHRGRVTDKGKLDGSAGHRRSCALFPRVLSGRDQASATPTIAITPADGSNARECIMRLRQLHDAYAIFTRRAAQFDALDWALWKIKQAGPVSFQKNTG